MFVCVHYFSQNLFLLLGFFQSSHIYINKDLSASMLVFVFGGLAKRLGQTGAVGTVSSSSEFKFLKADWRSEAVPQSTSVFGLEAACRFKC